MSVMPYVPKSVPLIMGTADLGEEARRTHRAPVWVLEPPIDTINDSLSIDGSAFRLRLGIAPQEVLIVSVSRLALDLKLDALVRAVDAAELLAARHPIRLVLVGGGPAAEALSDRAAGVNSRVGREVVTLAGAMLDPREAYAAADIVVGMGSSALRAMAIGRPVVVQGEKSFSMLFEPDTEEIFMRQGFYGLGDDEPGAGRLAGQLERLITDAALRQRLGRFGRERVEERFSLTRAAVVQLSVYEEVLRQPPRRSLSEALHVSGLALKLEINNHDPRRKARLRVERERYLGAARLGAWPPGRTPG